jgi:DDE superfamily endonuclease
MNLASFALPVLTMLPPTFSTPTDKRFLVLPVGALLTTGRRTITNMRCTVRHQAPGHASSYHHVFSWRRWSMWVMARALISFLLDHVVRPGPVLLAGDDTVTEHPVPHVFGKGQPCDGVRSSHRYPAYRWRPQLDFCPFVRQNLARTSLLGSWPRPPSMPRGPGHPRWFPVMTGRVLTTPGKQPVCENPTAPIRLAVHTSSSRRRLRSI